MGVIGWLQKRSQEEVTGTRVLICGLGQKFATLVKADATVWNRFYPSVTANVASELKDVYACIENRYDVVYLHCDASPDGVVRDQAGFSSTGTQVIEKCANCEVKLLWIASDNPAGAYISGFRATGKRLNLVMNIRRKDKFSESLEKLLSLMSRGERMPVAWNSLWPQIPGVEHEDAPDGISFAGRGGVVLLP